MTDCAAAKALQQHREGSRWPWGEEGFLHGQNKEKIKVLASNQVNAIHSFILLKAISRKKQKGGILWKGKENVKIN